MNKFVTVLLSSVGTLGVATGTVAVLDNIPATKDKINISYGEIDIVGNNNEIKAKYENLITKLENENQEKENRIELLNTSISNSNVKIATLQAENAEKVNQIAQLETDNLNKIEEIEILNASIEANNQRIAELEQSGEDKSLEIAQLQADNQSKDSQIAGLNSVIATNNETISELETVKSSNELIIEGLRSEVTLREEEIVSLQTQLETNNTTISQLQSQIDNYESALENYAIVTYVVNGTETVVLQDKGSNANYQESLPKGYISGWSFDEAGSNVVSDDYIVQNGDVLYGILAGQPASIKVHLDLTIDDATSMSDGEYYKTTLGTVDFSDLSFPVLSLINNEDYLLRVYNSKFGFGSLAITGFKYVTVDDGVEHEVSFEELFNTDFEEYQSVFIGVSYPMYFDSCYFMFEELKSWSVVVKPLDESGNPVDRPAYVSSIDFIFGAKSLDGSTVELF